MHLTDTSQIRLRGLLVVAACLLSTSYGCGDSAESAPVSPAAGDSNDSTGDAQIPSPDAQTSETDAAVSTPPLPEPEEIVGLGR